MVVEMGVRIALGRVLVSGLLNRLRNVARLQFINMAEMIHFFLFPASSSTIAATDRQTG